MRISRCVSFWRKIDKSSIRLFEQLWKEFVSFWHWSIPFYDQLWFPGQNNHKGIAVYFALLKNPPLIKFVSICNERHVRFLSPIWISERRSPSYFRFRLTQLSINSNVSTVWPPRLHFNKPVLTRKCFVSIVWARETSITKIFQNNRTWLPILNLNFAMYFKLCSPSMFDVSNLRVIRKLTIRDSGVAHYTWHDLTMLV